MRIHAARQYKTFRDDAEELIELLIVVQLSNETFNDCFAL
jgi:uncharacterized protein YlaN (UPF0358 family)